MANYTTLAAVQKIVVYDTGNVTDAQQQIDDAHVMVISIIGDALDDGVAADLAVLELVERYLAAHLISITDPRLASNQVSKVQESYQSKLADGLGITHYGATAMQMDKSGKLAQWNKKVISGLTAPMQLFWGGTERETDTGNE